MPRNRVIYQTEALYVGPSPSTGIHHGSDGSNPRTKQLHRIQSANYGYSLSRRDVNQFGELAAIDRIILESPVVNLDFSYLNATFYNELMMGFWVNSGANGNRSCISNILDKTQDDKNYFVKTVREGVDAIGNGDEAENRPNFIGVGNGFISNFSTEGAVGDFPRTTITIEGLNITFQRDNNNQSPNDPGFDDVVNVSGICFIDNPAINPSNGQSVSLNPNTQISRVIIPIATSSPSTGQGFSNQPGYTYGMDITSKDPYTISALKPGDITINILEAGLTTPLQELGVSISDAKIQSYNLNFALTRDPLEKLGSKYAFAREIRFPIQVSLAIEANVGDIFTGNLVDAVTSDKSYDLEVNISHPQTGAFKVMKYVIKNAKLDSQNYSSSIGPNKSVSLNFSSQIGGPLQTDKGLFFSGYLPNF